MKKAIYPGSFDPATLWHKDAIKRAATQTDELTVWVWQNPNKNYMFSFPEKVHIIEGAIKDEVENGLNIKVKPFSWLLVDFAYKQWIGTIIKGIRGQGDTEYEQMLHTAWETQKLWIETMLLFAAQDKTHISSSMTKWILKEQWNISEYVTLNVKHALESRMMDQYIVWVTGTIWAWKSYITEQFVQLWEKHNIPVHDIDLDKIGHYILWAWTEPGYIKVRQELAVEFGEEIVWKDGFIDRKILGPIVFWDAEKRKRLDEILKTPINLQIRQEMKGKKWIMLINGALLAESGNTDTMNNNVVLVWVDQKVQAERLKGRWHDNDEIARRLGSQYTTEKKKDILLGNINRSKYGSLLDFENNWDNADEIERQFFKMVNKADIYGELRIKSVLKKLWIEDKFLEIYSLVKTPHDWVERAYHNWFHIVACFNHLYDIKNDIDEKGFHELMFAFMFHDIVYDASRIEPKGINEKESAEFARQELTKLNIPGLDIDRVVHLIHITADHETDSGNLVDAYMIDIDMSILWTPWHVYSKYMNQVREEFSCFPDEPYNAWRIQFLKGQIGKNIFSTPYFHDKFHDRSQENIAKEIVILESRIKQWIKL